MSYREADDAFLPEYETVSTLFYKLTSPQNNGQVDRDLLAMFCQKIDCEPAGRSVALQVIIHKIQSPCEAEALIALDVLKACVESCDSAFRQEIGKFKFLNEMIKVLSPKYLGNKSSEKVKKRVSDLFYSWTLLMPTQPKIAEAYRLLKKQNLIVGNPDRQSSQKERGYTCQPQRMTSIFNDSVRTRRIAELLKSTHPDDILEANRLIKRMAQEDEIRTTKLYQRSVRVRSIRTSAVVLDEMIDNFDPERDSFDVLQLLYEQLRENSLVLQEMATASDEADDRLGEVLEVNDLVLHVLKRFESSKLHECTSGLHTGSNRDDVNELIDLTQSQSQMPDLIAEEVADRTSSLVDDALSGVFAIGVPFSDEPSTGESPDTSRPIETTDTSSTVAIAQDTGLNMLEFPADDTKDTALLELDRAAAEIVDNELAKTTGSDRFTDSLLEFLAPAAPDIEEQQVETLKVLDTPDATEAETSTGELTSDSVFTLKISDFSPVEGSSPKKLLERQGLRLTVFEGQRLEPMTKDSYLILLTLENRSPQKVTDLEIDFGEDVQILQHEGTKVGELLPFNPVLPASSYIQLYLLRPMVQQSKIEINLSYKVNSDRHFLHAEHNLLGGR